MPIDREATKTPKSQARAVCRAGDGWCLESLGQVSTEKDLRWHGAACSTGPRKISRHRIHTCSHPQNQVFNHFQH